jgi:ribosomal protein L7/L12
MATREDTTETRARIAEAINSRVAMTDYETGEVVDAVIAAVNNEATGQTFAVHMDSFGTNKVAAIKVIKDRVTGPAAAGDGIGLNAAKKLVESAPCIVAEFDNEPDAAELADELKAIGVIVDIRPRSKSLLPGFLETSANELENLAGSAHLAIEYVDETDLQGRTLKGSLRLIESECRRLSEEFGILADELQHAKA